MKDICNVDISRPDIVALRSTKINSRRMNEEISFKLSLCKAGLWRKPQKLSVQTKARVKERAADSADHIKVSDVTNQDLAGVCACMCILLLVCVCVCVCVFCSKEAMNQTLGQPGGTLRQIVGRCVKVCICTHHVFALWTVRCVCACVWDEEDQIAVSADIWEGETEKKKGGGREKWSSGNTLRLVFLHRGFSYTLVVISLTNNLPGGLSVRT